MGSPLKKSILVAGLPVHLYGLDRLDEHVPAVDVVFLLHGRTSNHLALEPMAQDIITHQPQPDVIGRGLLVVSIDQRNHGQREASSLSNLTWCDGNSTHAQDMFAMLYGTHQDVSYLITFLPAFIFPEGRHHVAKNIVVGVSLGGHAAYHLLSDDSRIAAGVVIIGCPDYLALMTPRAGRDVEMLLPADFVKTVRALAPRVEEVSKKDILILRGENDLLVPWSASESFVGQLPASKTEVVGFPGIGHQLYGGMVEKTVDWIHNWRQSL